MPMTFSVSLMFPSISYIFYWKPCKSLGIPYLDAPNESQILLSLFFTKSADPIPVVKIIMKMVLLVCFSGVISYNYISPIWPIL